MPQKGLFQSAYTLQKMDSDRVKQFGEVNKFLVDAKTINSKHKAVTIGFFFTDNMFRSVTLQVGWQG